MGAAAGARIVTGYAVQRGKRPISRRIQADPLHCYCPKTPGTRLAGAVELEELRPGRAGKAGMRVKASSGSESVLAAPAWLPLRGPQARPWRSTTADDLPARISAAGLAPRKRRGGANPHHRGAPPLAGGLDPVPPLWSCVGRALRPRTPARLIRQ